MAHEKASLEQREQLRLLLANAQIIGLWDWHIPEDRVFADERFAKLYGVEPARAAAGAPIAEFVEGVHPDDRDRLREAINQSLSSGAAFGIEYRLRSPDGLVRHVLARGHPTYGEDGAPIRFGGASIDITDQRSAEIALRESEDRYRTLFNSIDAGFCIIEMKFDSAGKPIDYGFVEINPAFERQTGLTDVIGKWIRDIAPAHEQFWFDRYGEIATTGEAARFEDHAAALGRWFDVYAFRIGDPAQRRVAVLFNDISETKRVENELRARENQFRTFAQAMPNHVWTSPPDGLLDWFNDRVYEYSGAQPGELDGVGWTSMVHPDDLPYAAERWAATLASCTPYETEFRLRRHDGAYRWHIARAAAIRTPDGQIARWIGANTDIEEQKTTAQALAELNATLEARVQERTGELMAAEAALRQSQKMEAIGQLTGGIAHDFNNLLTGVIGSLALMRRRIDAGRFDEVERFMQAATSSAQRAAALTHRLLAFARRQSLDAQSCDMSALVSGMRDLLRQTIGENIELEIKAADNLWPALTDAHQMESALLNLAINARDAMPDGGRLTISIGNETLGAAAARAEGAAPGDYVVVSVADTGTGMTPDVAAKAFDPFFTTKPIGQGTGLGLSMIYGFLKQSGGLVRLENELGRGVTVKLYAPRAMNAALAPAAASNADAPRGQGEVVLVVEDDEAVRLLVTALLSELGYRYLEAGDARTALPMLRSAERVDLLITDVGLPHMNGRQLAEIARQQRPDLRVLFMTGYAETAAARGDFLGPGMEMIAKPFELDALGARIRALLDAERV